MNHHTHMDSLGRFDNLDAAIAEARALARENGIVYHVIRVARERKLRVMTTEQIGHLPYGDHVRCTYLSSEDGRKPVAPHAGQCDPNELETEANHGLPRTDHEFGIDSSFIED